jgi:hypothetical protein
VPALAANPRAAWAAHCAIARAVTLLVMLTVVCGCGARQWLQMWGQPSIVLGTCTTTMTLGFTPAWGT